MTGRSFESLGPDGGCGLEDAVQAAVAAEEHEDLDGDGGHSDPPQMWMARTENLTTRANMEPS